MNGLLSQRIEQGIENINESVSKNTTFYECYDQPTSLKRNTDEAFNVFLFTTVNQYGGVQSGKGMWIGDFKKYYDNYLADNNNTWQIAHRGKLFNHEMMHIFSLDHPKRNSVGKMNTLQTPSLYLDNCNDTPTYLDLINDGWTDPYLWNDPINHLYSNNILDYSADQRALTPCQINKAHSYIDASLSDYIYGNFISASEQITSFSDNAAFIAETIEIPSGSSITIANGKRLYIDAEEFVVNGEFGVPLGSEFEFTPTGM